MPVAPFFAGKKMHNWHISWFKRKYKSTSANVLLRLKENTAV